MAFLELAKSLKPIYKEHWIMLLVFLYSVISPLSHIFSLDTFVESAAYCIFGFVFLLIVFCSKKKFNFQGTIGFFYGILLIWSIWLTFHMFFTGFDSSSMSDRSLSSIMHVLFKSPYVLPNFLPFVLIAIADPDNFDFNYLWRLMWLSCILYLLIYPFAFWSMTHYNLASFLWSEGYGDFVKNSTMGIAAISPCILMIFLKRYIPLNQWAFFLAAAIGGFLLTAYMGRRGATAMSVLYFFSCLLLYTICGKEKILFKTFIVFLLLVGIGSLFFRDFCFSFFSTLLTRGFTDTRSGVEASFFLDMGSVIDWLFGRGWLGEYYDIEFGRNRMGIETGYLTLILKGGLIYLISYVACLFISAFKGLFKSKNLLCKSFAILCFIQILRLYTFGWPNFNIHHLCIWIGVMVCNSDYCLCLSDDEVSQIFFNRL